MLKSLGKAECQNQKADSSKENLFLPVLASYNFLLHEKRFLRAEKLKLRIRFDFRVKIFTFRKIFHVITKSYENINSKLKNFNSNESTSLNDYQSQKTPENFPYVGNAIGSLVENRLSRRTGELP